MNIEVDNVKGFQDYLPLESLKRDKIKKVAEKHFKLYGFAPVETPVVEYDELMKPDSLPSEDQDEAISDRFRLKDRAGRNLGLRYEFTFQLARILKQNPNLKMPFRRYQIGDVFRDEPLRAGRTRQFTQCDVDIIGDPSIKADAEIISVVNDIFKELRIKDFEIQVNNRKLLSAIIDSVQIKSQKSVMRELDKICKVGEDIVKTELKKYADSNQILTLFKLLEKDLSFFKQNMFDGAEELDKLIKRCANYGIKVKFNPFMIRGFAYYTGNIFEFVVSGKNTISGGGRYDNSVGRYLGREIPAVGLSFSLEALMGICSDEINDLDLEKIPVLMIIPISQEKIALSLAKELRLEGISCIISDDKVGKSLEYANSYNIPYVVIIGEDEAKKNKLKLKDMKSGEEKLIVKSSLIKEIREKIEA